jgi:hypothetical protein
MRRSRVACPLAGIPALNFEEVIAEMMWLKGCPKCTGDLVAEEDEYTEYIKCLQCGRILTGTEEERLKALSVAARAAKSNGRVLVLPREQRAA